MTDTTISRPDGARIRIREYGGRTGCADAPVLALSNVLAVAGARTGSQPR